MEFRASNTPVWQFLFPIGAWGNKTAVKPDWLQASAGPLILPESSWLSSGKTCDRKPNDKCGTCYCCRFGGFFFSFFFFVCLSWLNVALVPGDGGKPVSHALRPILPTAPSPPYLPDN